MKRTALKIAAIGTSLTVIVGTTVAVRGFFDRPGESALRFIPADAGAVITEDLVPAPSQVLAFEKIQNALDKSGVKPGHFNPIDAELNEYELSQVVGRYIGKSLAVAIYMGKPDATKEPNAAGASPLGDASGIGFVSLTDPAAADAALQKAWPATNAHDYHSVPDGRLARVADGYLEIATDPIYFSKVDAVKNGKVKSIASVAGFKAARAMAEPGANVKCFAKNTSSGVWSVVSGSVEDSGISVVFRGGKGAVSGNFVPIHVKPISPSTLQKIPSGAYAIFGIAGPGGLLGNFGAQLGSLGPSLASAFGGDTVIALYPSEKSPRAGIDLLLLLGANNGAKPHTAFKELREQAEAQLLGGQHIFGKPIKIGHASYYGPTDQISQMLKQGMKSPMEGVKAKVLLRDKTVAYATEGESLYFCTSSSLLKRAIATTDGSAPSIAHDASFKPFADGVASHSEILLAISASRIAEGIANTTTKDNEEAKQAKDAIRMATHNDAIVSVNIGAQRDGSFHGRMFIPMDYTRMSAMIKAAKGND
jgi:hypothetical protein